jgi:serine protease Do
MNAFGLTLTARDRLSFEDKWAPDLSKDGLLVEKSGVSRESEREEKHIKHRPAFMRLVVVVAVLLAMILPSAAVVASSSSTVVTLWVGNNIMVVAGVRQPIDSEGTKPVIVEGRTLVPIRAVIEAFKGSVVWDATVSKVTVTLGENALNLLIGKSTASLNGTMLPVDGANPRVVPVITNGRTMLPLRFVAESLGIDVQYEAATKMITLTYTVDTTSPPPTGSSVPSVPRLLTPANQSILDSTSIVLTWASVTDADSYRIQVLRDGTEVHAAGGISDTAYTVPTGVLGSGKYGWQAAAHSSGGWSPWSGAYSFEVRTKLTVSDIAKYVDRMVLIQAQGSKDGNAFSASGSGFLVGTDGRIVTNYHVIDAATQGSVTLNGGQKYNIASVLGYNKDQDLAVIQISGTGFPICTLGDSSNVAVGDPVVAIGSPLGIQNTVSEGIISKILDDGDLQITAAISPGSSGGALFNMNGEVIGVTTWKIQDGENMNGAVPVNLVRGLDTSSNLTLAQVYQKEYAGVPVVPVPVVPAPVLLSPAPDAVISTLTPTLSWGAVSGATRYEVQIWAAPKGPPFLIDNVVAATSYTVPAGVLSSGTTYGWTVCAGNSLGWGDWATMPGTTYAPEFTVQAPPSPPLLSPPSLLEPTEGESIFPRLTGGTATFTWSATPGAVSYTLWIGSGLSGDESTNVYRKATSATSYSIATSTLVAGRLYTWAIGTQNSAGNIAWSIDRHFNIVDDGGVVLLSPTNYSTISTNPTMIWTPYSGATDYFLVLCQGTPLASSTPIFQEDVYGMQYTLPSFTLTHGQSYWWYVLAQSGGTYVLAQSANGYFSVSP